MKKIIFAILLIFVVGVEAIGANWNPTYTTTTYTYDGAPHTFQLSFSNYDGCSNANNSLTNINSGNDGTYLKFHDGTHRTETNAGSYAVQLENTCSGHQGIYGFVWTINKRNISSGTTVTRSGWNTYNTGSPLTFTLTNNGLNSSYRSQTLTSGTEYTSNYSTNAGSHTATFTGAGTNFDGSTTFAYSIAQKDINSSDITIAVNTATYTGGAITPVITITDYGVYARTLTTDDFNFTPISFTNAGTYAITITGKGNYTGSRTVDFTILPRNVDELNITTTKAYDSGFTANADELKTWIEHQGIKFGSNTMAPWEYTLTVAADTYHDAKTYTAAVTLTAVNGGNLTGSVNKDFIISNGIDISKNSYLVYTADSYTYTGADLPPTSANTKVYCNGNLLSSTTDYDFAIAGATTRYRNAGTYDNAVIITGKGAYFGTIYASYTILQRPLTECTVSASNIAYDGTSHPTASSVSVTYLSNNIASSEYTVSPANVTAAGTYTLTITANDNKNVSESKTCTLLVTKALDGTYSSHFAISPDPIPTKNWTGSAIEPAITITDNGEPLTQETDYTIAYTNNTNEGQATITITGAGAFSGTITKNFYIIKTPFTVGDFTYSHLSEGEDVTIKSTTATGYVAPSSTVTYQGATLNVVGVENGAFNNTGILAVTLPGTIKTIANGSFGASCTGLRYVDASSLSSFIPSGLDRTSGANAPFANVPKQALVYLYGATATGENYVYNIGGGNYRCEVFKIYDDVNGDQKGFSNSDKAFAYENKYEFVANTLTNTRQLNSGQHYTTCLPYPLTIPSGVQAYTLSASSSKLLSFEAIEGTTLNAFTPYVIIPSSVSGQLLSGSDITVPVTTTYTTEAAFQQLNATTATSGGHHQLVGSLRYMTTGKEGCYIMQSGNTWKEFKVTSTYPNACILPMRAYVINSAYPSAARPHLSAVFNNGDGSTTAIDDLRLNPDDPDDAENSVLFDLQGRRVTTPPSPGIYIRNGKKIIVK